MARGYLSNILCYPRAHRASSLYRALKLERSTFAAFSVFTAAARARIASGSFGDSLCGRLKCVQVRRRRLRSLRDAREPFSQAFHRSQTVIGADRSLPLHVGAACASRQISAAPRCAHAVHSHVSQFRFFRRLEQFGSLAFGRSYVHGSPSIDHRVLCISISVVRHYP